MAKSKTITRHSIDYNPIDFEPIRKVALTFTGTAMTGDAGTTIDVGSGNTLHLQDTNNGPITTGSGLVTVTNLLVTKATTTNLRSASATITSLVATNVTSTNLNITNTSSSNVSSTRLDVTTTAGSSTISASTNLVRMAAHVNSTGTIPTVGTCGTTPTIVGTDNAAIITVGTGSVTSCTETFASAFTSPPVCVIANANTSTPLVFMASSTATTFSIDSFDIQTSTIALKTMAQVKFRVICLGID